MDGHSADRNACAQDYLPRFLNPLLLVMLDLQGVIPTPPFGDVRPERIALYVERELEILGSCWAKREFHDGTI
jgi:hypothetical protein